MNAKQEAEKSALVLCKVIPLGDAVMATLAAMPQDHPERATGVELMVQIANTVLEHTERLQFFQSLAESPDPDWRDEYTSEDAERDFN
jgi:hypothetical protein